MQGGDTSAPDSSCDKNEEQCLINTALGSQLHNDDSNSNALKVSCHLRRHTVICNDGVYLRRRTDTCSAHNIQLTGVGNDNYLACMVDHRPHDHRLVGFDHSYAKLWVHPTDSDVDLIEE